MNLITLICFLGLASTSVHSAEKCSALFDQDSGSMADSILAKSNAELAYKQNTLIQRTQKLKSTLQQIATRDPVFAKLVKMLEAQTFTFAMDRKAKQRDNILESQEFLNIHQAQTSSGTFQPDFRLHVEAEYLGLDLAEYKNSDIRLKPKSLYLYPLKESAIESATTVYAENLANFKAEGDTWIFDLNQIRGATRFVVGDSYNRALIERDMTSDNKTFSVDPEAKLKKDSHLDYVLPIEMLWQALPFFYDQVKKTNHLRFVEYGSPEYMRKFEEFKEDFDGMMYDWQEIMLNDYKPDLGTEFYKAFPELQEFADLFQFKPYGNYVEGLFYGKLSLSSVKAFIFRKEPPTESQMKRFRQLGIQVIDGRSK